MDIWQFVLLVVLIWLCLYSIVGKIGRIVTDKVTIEAIGRMFEDASDEILERLEDYLYGQGRK